MCLNQIRVKNNSTIQLEQFWIETTATRIHITLLSIETIYYR